MASVRRCPDLQALVGWRCGALLQVHFAAEQEPATLHKMADDCLLAAGLASACTLARGPKRLSQGLNADQIVHLDPQKRPEACSRTVLEPQHMEEEPSGLGPSTEAMHDRHGHDPCEPQPPAYDSWQATNPHHPCPVTARRPWPSPMAAAPCLQPDSHMLRALPLQWPHPTSRAPHGGEPDDHGLASARLWMEDSWGGRVTCLRQLGLQPLKLKRLPDGAVAVGERLALLRIGRASGRVSHDLSTCRDEIYLGVW